jgi:dTDP-4-dehydrorhamnose 3,5-epimerase
MKFTPLPLHGACLIEIEPVEDERGFFARTWCAEEFKSHGLSPGLSQCGISFNKRRGTLRGMHYQAEPFAETKLVRCSSGEIYDVIVDLRRASPTCGNWFSVELSAANRKMLYVPEGFARGFQTLTDGAEVCYQISQVYKLEYSRGVRWNDPSFNIPWPISDVIISERDRIFPDFTP